VGEELVLFSSGPSLQWVRVVRRFQSTNAFINYLFCASHLSTQYRNRHVPGIKMVGSFLTYHRLKERGGLPVGGQTIEDIVAFATQNMLTENTPRNVGGCVHLTYDTQRDEPFFVMLISTNGLLDGMHLTSPIETDETYKVIYEGYPVTVIGQSDINRTFHVR
jgi:hypothetical protein